MLALLDILDVSPLTPKLKCNCKKKGKKQEKKSDDRRCPFVCSSIRVLRVDDNATNA